MAKHVESAKVFFEALDCGRGHDLLAAHATPDASFECAALPMKTLEEYAIFMKEVATVTIPDFSAEVRSVTYNENVIVFVATCKGTASGPGGPVPPSDPPKSMVCDYAYTFHYNEEGKIIKLHKVFDIWSAFSKLGWPLGQ